MDTLLKMKGRPISIGKYIFWVMVSNIFGIFSPIWGSFPFWRAYFSNGLVQPPTSLPIPLYGFSGACSFCKAVKLWNPVNETWYFLNINWNLGFLPSTGWIKLFLNLVLFESGRPRNNFCGGTKGFAMCMSTSKDIFQQSATLFGSFEYIYIFFADI